MIVFNSSLEDVSSRLYNLVNILYPKGMPLIPIMTSNTTPSGNVTYSSIYSSEYDGWRAFNGFDDSYGYSPSSRDKFGTAYVQYEFDSPKIAKAVDAQYNLASTSTTSVTFTYKLEGSNNGSDFVPLVNSIAMVNSQLSKRNIDNNTAYKYYRFVYVSNSDSTITRGSGVKFQLYGY